MAHVVVPLADGFEEIEAVAVVDILRRAGLRVTVAGVDGDEAVGSHGMRIRCDARLDDVTPREADAVVLPGGLPGTRRLAESEAVASLVRHVNGREGLVAAICAAPTVLAGLGLLEGRRATSHPAHRDEMGPCRYETAAVVRDGNVVTSRGAGTAVEFALELVRILVDDATADDIARRIVHAGQPEPGARGGQGARDA